MDKLDSIEDVVKEITKSICDENGIELFDVEFISGGNKKDLLRIVIDAPGGATVANCTKVSRELSTLLDVSDLIDNRFTLEVSTPGLDRKLRHLEDALASIGKKVRIVSLPMDGRKKFSGRLVGVEGDSLVIEDKENRYLIPWDKVRRANIEFEF